MSFFTSILTAAFGGFASTAFGSFLISTIAKVATSALVSAILGQEQRKPERNIGIKGKLQAGGDLSPRFPVGKCRIDGQLIYHNTWGESLGAPNGWQTEVIKL
ncbi:MAG: hypothetical protein MI867_19760, partial [Pseudomonadales bacterium]|nr:hypothetical protein [Pseudomonadales bacterium]